jgi:hypothetical protein
VGADVENLTTILGGQAHACRSMGSDFYGDLLDLMADDVVAGGPTWDLLGPHAGEPFDLAHHLRLLAGVHRLVLSGQAPSLAAHYPSTGGDGDARSAWSEFTKTLSSRPWELLDCMKRPPQTNEVGRSASLAAGVMVVAQTFNLPIRLLEIGSSAGLNLRMDRYWYSQGGRGWGDRGSTVRFVDLWQGADPPFDAAPEIRSRRGCDRDPIELTEDGSRELLLSYVWPGQEERFGLLDSAVEIGRRHPVDIDRADVGEWLAPRLHEDHPDTSTVVFHSIVWQYLDSSTKQHVTRCLEEAGRSADRNAPLAWLRLEPNERISFAELRLTTWPGGDERLLATAGFHAGPVRWRATSSTG